MGITVGVDGKKLSFVILGLKQTRFVNSFEYQIYIIGSVQSSNLLYWGKLTCAYNSFGHEHIQTHFSMQNGLDRATSQDRGHETQEYVISAGQKEHFWSFLAFVQIRRRAKIDVE